MPILRDTSEEDLMLDIKLIVKAEVEAQLAARDPVKVGYGPTPLPNTQLWWTMRLLDGRMLIVGRNLPWSGVSYRLTNGSHVDVPRLRGPDPWLGKRAAIDRAHKTWQVLPEPPEYAVSVIAWSQLKNGTRVIAAEALLPSDQPTTPKHEFKNQTLYNVDEPLVGGPVVLDGVIVAGGGLRIHQADYVILSNVQFIGTDGSGALEIRGCKRVFIMNTSYSGTAGGVVFHDWPKHPTSDVLCYNTVFAGTYGGVNRNEGVVIENGTNTYRRIAFDQMMGNDVGPLTLWNADVEDLTISHTTLGQLSLGAKATMRRTMFWSAFFNSIKVREDQGTLPWDEQIKNDCYMFGLKHYRN